MVSCNYKINNITDEEFNAFANSSISLRKLFVTAKNEKYVFEVGPIFIAMFAVMPMAITTIMTLTPLRQVRVVMKVKKYVIFLPEQLTVVS